MWIVCPLVYTCKPSRANTARAKRVRMMTSLRFLTEYTMADTMVLSPGMTATDFKARNTRNVRSAEKLCNVKLMYFKQRCVG